MPRHFGAIDGVPVGATFSDRVALSRAGVHRPTQPGISGSTDGEGADSIVLSGGYGDDAFDGETILYTGQGGRDAAANRQVRDQPWNAYNAALARSIVTGRPVRVARKVEADGERVYRYEGLYRVETHRRAEGQDGYAIWQYVLTRLPVAEARAWGETWPGDAAPTPLVTEGDDVPGIATDDPAAYGPTPRTEVVVQRLVRDTPAARRVKRLHDHRCQLCGTRVDTPAGPYVEAAHVRPLGQPHDGPDVPENLLCLCPNCHVRFDLGAVAVADDGTLLGLPGTLRTVRGHRVDAAHLAYHRDRIFHPPGDDG